MGAGIAVGERRRRRLVRNGVVVALLNGVVELKSGKRVGQSRIGDFGGSEPESELDAGFELVEIVVRQALPAAAVAGGVAPL